MRQEASGLFQAGVFYPSFAYRGDERLEKKNVWNFELDGHEWDYAPSLLMYTREILLHLPPLLNSLSLPLPVPPSRSPSRPPSLLRLSPRGYANKIAVSTGGGSHFLRHTDNNNGDSRKVTLVYYLNPEWPSGNGGQLRLYPRSGAYGQEEGLKNTSGGEGTEADGGEEGHVDVWPEGDTLVMFLSEELEHEVLPNWSEEEKDHRWTYTLWLVEEGGCEGES
ncbi:prolyl 4-hydroxylase [Nannochloropsis gaditana]|uniref:Prolyl 4-hydroxylase n=1 Tax=Nannochloropsis gaditana TaxID=72520 RepID=W7TAJ0_9STRA|nr:prolyl 4-hydroxylase [Nannochloropsis gaditana]